MLVTGKNVLVLGLGKTGISVIRQIKKTARSITALDDHAHRDLGIRRGRDMRIVLGKKARQPKLLDTIHLVVPSPGVCAQHPIITQAKKRGIPVASEIELAWSLLDPEERKNTIAVTGTNGKTTAVNLLGEIFQGCRRPVCVCGNVGYPLISTVDKKNLLRVIEVSSFQLEWISSFAPHIGILLNISSDHLDRHGTMEAYARLKFRLFENQQDSDYCILNADDELVFSTSAKLPVGSTVIRYGQKKEYDVFPHDDALVYELGSSKGSIDIANMQLKGSHNISNTMACVAAAKLLGVQDTHIQKALARFKPLAHRMEFVGVYRGVACYNDSKSTNPQAAIAALEHFEKPLTLIMGGKDKGMDLHNLLRVLAHKVSALILIGQSSEKMMQLLGSGKQSFTIYVCSTLREAVGKGLAVTPRGGTFLLSPAFASMDMFQDYKDRGNQYKSLLKENHGNPEKENIKNQY